MSSTIEYHVSSASGRNGAKGKPDGDFRRQAGGGGLLRGARSLVGSRRDRAPEIVSAPSKGENSKDAKRLAKAQSALLARTRKLVTDRDDIPLYISWMKGGSMVARRMLASSEEIRSLWKGGDDRKATALIEIFTLAMISRWYRFLDRKLDQPETERRLARRIAAANVLQIFDEYSDESIEQAVADLIKLDTQHNRELDQDRADAQPDPASEEENVLGLRALWACGSNVQFDLQSAELSESNGAGQSSPSIPRWTTKPEELTVLSEALDEGADATLRFLKNRPADDLSAVAYVPVPFPRSRRFEAMVEPEASSTAARPHQQLEAPQDAVTASSTAQDGETEPDSVVTEIVEPAATTEDEQTAEDSAAVEPVSTPTSTASDAMAAIESPIHAIVEQLIVEAYRLTDRVKEEASREAEAHAAAIRADAERVRDQILKPAQAHAAERAKALVADAEELAKGIVERAAAEAEAIIQEATERAASQESDAAMKIRGLAEHITGELKSGVSSLDEILPGASSTDDSPTAAK